MIIYEKLILNVQVCKFNLMSWPLSNQKIFKIQYQ